jgi:hypothetical protein
MRNEAEVRSIVQAELREFAKTLFAEVHDAPTTVEGYILRDDLIACIRRVGRKIGMGGMT